MLIHLEILKILVQTVLLFATQKLMAVTLPICVVIVYLVQKLYLQISRQLRLLEPESQSAVYSSFLESVWHNLEMQFISYLMI